MHDGMPCVFHPHHVAHLTQPHEDSVEADPLHPEVVIQAGREVAEGARPGMAHKVRGWARQRRVEDAGVLAPLLQRRGNDDVGDGSLCRCRFAQLAREL